MLFHVIHKVVEELDLLLQHGGVLLHSVVVLAALEVNVVNVGAIAQKEQFGQVVEDHADTFITERVAETIFVGVVHPFAHPDHRRGFGILDFVLGHSSFRGRIGCDNL